MITKGLIGATTPTASILGSKVSSPLRWVHTSKEGADDTPGETEGSDNEP